MPELPQPHAAESVQPDLPPEEQPAEPVEEKADAKDGEVQVKTLDSWEIKDESTGEVEAIIATLMVVDKDKEVITKTAIKSGAKVKMSAYAHDMVGGMFGGGAMPVGKGAVHIEKDKAIFRGKIFTSTQRGRETLEVLKEMGPDQEWSFGFRVLGSEIPDEEWAKQGAELILTKLDVFEVSPVLIGAGIGTQTVAAKSRKAKALAEQAQKDADAAAEAAKKAEADAQAAQEAEAAAARAQAEREEAERLAAENEEARLAAERKQAAEELQAKERQARDREEYDRVQRSIRRMGISR